VEEDVPKNPWLLLAGAAMLLIAAGAAYAAKSRRILKARTDDDAIGARYVRVEGPIEKRPMNKERQGQTEKFDPRRIDSYRPLAQRPGATNVIVENDHAQHPQKY
jgi:hypothetical protein